MPGPDGRLVHAAVRINGFLVMLNDDFPEMCGGKSMTPESLGGTPVTIHLTVTDVDAKFQRALDAGATVVRRVGGPVLGRPLRRGRRPVRPPLVAGAAGARGQPRGDPSGDVRRRPALASRAAAPAAGVASAAPAARSPRPPACRRHR